MIDNGSTGPKLRQAGALQKSHPHTQKNRVAPVKEQPDVGMVGFYQRIKNPPLNFTLQLAQEQGLAAWLRGMLHGWTSSHDRGRRRRYT